MPTGDRVYSPADISSTLAVMDRVYIIELVKLVSII